MTASGVRLDRRILLADADAFYVGVARLIDPDGAGKEPLLIVGGASNRGVVTSASYEARAYGVHSAMPTARALRLCPKAVVVPVPRDACSTKSREIRDVLERFTPVVEAASIDEFFLDMTGTERLYRRPLEETAHAIRDAVADETGLTVSIGGGTSRLIAKLAAKEAKPRPGRDGGGVYLVPPGTEASFVSTLDLADLPMVGPKMQERLARYGLRTVRDALAYDRQTLESWFGERTGRWLYRRIRGIDGGAVHGRRGAKSLSHEETFFTDLVTDEDLDRELLRMAVRVAADLRRHQYRTRTITVKLRDADFTTRQASHTLDEAVSADRPILETARDLLRRLRRARYTAARLLGVSATQLVGRDDADQLGLFEGGTAGDGEESAHDRALARVVDDITTRFGRHGIRRAAEVRPHPRGS